MSHFHMIEVRYFPHTNHRGQYLKLYSERFKQSQRIPYDYGDENTMDITIMARKWLVDRSFKVVGTCDTEKGYGLLSTTFKPIRETKNKSTFSGASI